MSIPLGMRLARFVAVVALLGLSGIGGYAQRDVEPVNNLPNPYETIRNWGNLPAGRTWGAVTAVEVAPDGKSLWVAERCGAGSCAGSNVPVVLQFNESGNLVRSFGAGLFVFPHGLHIDRDSNVWVTDARGATPEEAQKFPDTREKGHQVIKFSPDGRVLLRLGKAGAAGNPPEFLNAPTDVITAPNGDIFVSEGHNSNLDAPPGTAGRISKFSKDGKFVKSWGKLGSAQGEFRTPHALVFDSRGRLFVADRGNSRIQIFDQEGKFLDVWEQFSRNSGLAMGGNDVLYAIDSESGGTTHPGWKEGIRIGSARDGTVMYFIPGHATDTTEIVAGEGVAVDAAGNVYAGEVTLRGITKYVRRTGSQ
ncbi:MAG: peptidyl-alpha-hydroxyglycine alpha-amidating lyase family protein [Terriglobia bacterium]